MTTSDELIAEISRKGGQIWVAGGASEDQIAAVAAKLGTLPPTYITFLQRYGALAIGDSAVSGIIDNNAADDTAGSVLGDTNRFRESQDFPPYLIVIGPHEDGGYCLDTSRSGPNGECPIVNFEFGSVQHKRSVAETFEDWLACFYLSGAAGE